MTIGFAFYKIIANKKGKPVNFKILEVNPAFERLTGFKAKNIIGKNINQIFPKTSKEKTDWIKLCSKVALTGKKEKIEQYFKRFKRWLRVYLFSTTKGYFVTLLSDLTEHKQTENALQESEEKYRSLLTNINVGIFRAKGSGEGEIVEVNPAMAKLLGYKSVDELKHASMIDMYQNPNDRQLTLRKLRKFGFVKNEELKMRKKDGTPFIAAATKHATQDKFGKIVWINGALEDITERKRAEQALIESEQKYRSLVENINIGIFRSSPIGKGRFIEANPAMVRMFGYKSTKEFLMRSVSDLYQNPKDRIAALNKIRKKGFLSAHELLFRKKDGTPITVSITARGHRDAKGNVDWIDGVIEDITERKRLEEEQRKKVAQMLRYQEQLLKLWQMKMPNFSEAIKKITEIDAKTLDVERVGFWLFAQDRSAIICEDLYLKSKNSHEKGMKLQIDAFPCYCRALEKGRIIPANDACHDHRTSEFAKKYLIPHNITSMMDAPVRLHGRVVGVVCHEHTGPIRKWTIEEQNFATSIADFISLSLETSERTRAKETLKESEERYRAIFNTANDGIVVLSPSGNIISANPQLYKTFDISEESLIGSNLSKLMKVGMIPPQSLATIQHNMKERFAGKDVKPYEIQVYSKDNKPKTIEISASLIRDASGKIVADLAIIRDITERKQAEIALQEAKESAEKANKIKTAFLANMSHELRTPMHSILGFTDILLEKEENGNKERKELLGIVKNSSDKLLHIINNLLDLSKIESGKMMVEKKAFNIIDMAYRLKLTHQPVAQQKGLKLDMRINKNIPEYIICDQTKIEQIIINLLDNSIKFTHQGKIELYLGMLEDEHLTKNKGILEFYVRDTGIGIEKEKMNNLFEQYLQTDMYLTRMTPGPRLGLAIVKQLTGLMKGQITVKSKIGIGTKILIRLPVDIVNRKNKNPNRKDKGLSNG